MNINSNSNISKYIRYDVSSILNKESKNNYMTNNIKEQDEYEERFDNISDKMQSIITFLKDHIKEIKINIISSSNNGGDEEIEYIETPFFMLFLSNDDNNITTLHVQFKIDLDVNICARIGLLLSNFYMNEIVTGFTFLDPYIIVQTEKNQLKYLYGKEAKEALENINFETQNINKFKEHFTDKFLDNINIDDLSPC